MDLRETVDDFIAALQEGVDDLVNNEIDDFTTDLADKTAKGNTNDYDSMFQLLQGFGYVDPGDDLTEREIILDLEDYIRKQVNY